MRKVVAAWGILAAGLAHGATQTLWPSELYKGYLRSALAHPRCAGTHGFQWSDQPLTGRGDGENYPVGFVSVADAPYPELTAASREIGNAMYAERFGRPQGK